PLDVLIATPGRLLDHLGSGKAVLGQVEMLILDEADRMLDMGFIPDIERICKLVPFTRQTLFFSATMPPEIRRLADAFLMNPKEISVAPPASPAATVIQGLAVVQPHDKREALRRLVRDEDVKNAIIFCNRKRDVDILYRSLAKHGFNCAALHGDMPQSKRTETLERFRHGEIKLLVASDVAARGLDIQGMSHVFNFDVPIHAEDYVHRIGRTGRAGREGRSYTLATPEDGRYVAAIEHLIGKPIPRVDLGDLAGGALETEGAEAHRGGRRRPRRGKAEGERRPRAAEPRSAERRPARRPTRNPRPQPQNEPRQREPRHAPVTMDPAAMQAADNVTPLPPRRDRRAEEPDDDRSIVGFGDHMPAFLARPRSAVRG
ncbi:MAG TPA: DEAD/DEAH box helicase, partial [Stellaceae bacterium]|nr:DEAD/DEAH box helicase [Stellaceae bacterium]